MTSQQVADLNDPSMAFYVNVQQGEYSVVIPPAGMTTDQFIYHFDYPGQPIVWLSHSNLTGGADSVLTRQQTYDLGRGLDAIHRYFAAAYATDSCEQFYAMDVEFKFDEGQLFVKQARPYPGRGAN